MSHDDLSFGSALPGVVTPVVDPYADVPAVGELAANGQGPPPVDVVARRQEDLRARLLDAEGLRNIPAPVPLVAELLYVDSLAWLQGKPGSAKSFVAVDLACCVGTGTPWHGHQVTAGRVLYLIAEGASGLSRRVDAWSLANGRPVDNVLFLPVPVQLLQAVDLAAFVALIGDLAPALVILDTQARVTVGGEENSSRDMGAYVDSLDQLRTVAGACVLSVHHEARNGDNMRGSTALEGAATTILRTEKDGRRVTITNPKQKDDLEQPPLTLALTAVGSSAILSHEAVGIVGLSTESELAVLAVLRDSFGTRGATKTELRDACGQAKTTYYRSVNALVTKGLMVERKEGRSTIYTPASTDTQPVIPTSPTVSHEHAGQESHSHHPFRGWDSHGTGPRDDHDPGRHDLQGGS